MKIKNIILFLVYFFSFIQIFPLEFNTKIVIFCYHRFNLKKETYSISDKMLLSQIELARKKGFNFINENELKDFYYKDGYLKPKNILITIDDGNSDDYKVAYPIFKKENISASFFIYPGFVGHKKFLKWNEIINMSSNNMYFGSHSMTHFNDIKLSKIKDESKYVEQIKIEFIDSAKIIEDNINKKIFSYAHPFGIFDPTIEKVTNVRYKLVYTTAKGPNTIKTNPHRLNRYIITKDIKLDEIEKYFDYELLPIVKTNPDNGGYIDDDKIVTFNFLNQTELNKFENFRFKIDGKIYNPVINNRSIIFDAKKIKRKVFDLSLICNDKLNNNYIYSILVNNYIP